MKNLQRSVSLELSLIFRYFLDLAIRNVEARDLGSRIVLIDGDQLTKLMIRYNIGCRDEEILHLKKVDEDFFE